MVFKNLFHLLKHFLELARQMSANSALTRKSCFTLHVRQLMTMLKSSVPSTLLSCTPSCTKKGSKILLMVEWVCFGLTSTDKSFVSNTEILLFISLFNGKKLVDNCLVVIQIIGKAKDCKYIWEVCCMRKVSKFFRPFDKKWNVWDNKKDITVRNVVSARINAILWE